MPRCRAEGEQQDQRSEKLGERLGCGVRTDDRLVTDPPHRCVWRIPNLWGHGRALAAGEALSILIYAHDRQHADRDGRIGRVR